MSSRTSSTMSPIVLSQNRSNSSYGTRLRLPTFTAWISPALIFREIVDRETPIASATCWRESFEDLGGDRVHPLRRLNVEHLGDLLRGVPEQFRGEVAGGCLVDRRGHGLAERVRGDVAQVEVLRQPSRREHGAKLAAQVVRGHERAVAGAEDRVIVGHVAQHRQP
jgi:hypothetical protein